MRISEKGFKKVIQSKIGKSSKKFSEKQKILWHQHGFMRAAVLILLFEKDENLFCIYIQRSKTFLKKGVEAIHSGQIAFPGGKLESGESAKEAALREAREEVFLSAQQVEFMTELGTFSTFSSRFLVDAFIGWLNHKPELKRNPAEVANIFYVPLADLLPQHRPDFNLYSFADIIALHYHWRPSASDREICIWGMTGRITWTLLDRLYFSEK